MLFTPWKKKKKKKKKKTPKIYKKKTNEHFKNCKIKDLK